MGDQGEETHAFVVCSHAAVARPVPSVSPFTRLARTTIGAFVVSRRSCDDALKVPRMGALFVRIETRFAATYLVTALKSALFCL